MSMGPASSTIAARDDALVTSSATQRARPYLLFRHRLQRIHSPGRKHHFRACAASRCAKCCSSRRLQVQRLLPASPSSVSFIPCLLPIA
jgi:hypothetical protein